MAYRVDVEAFHSTSNRGNRSLYSFFYQLYDQTGAAISTLTVYEFVFDLFIQRVFHSGLLGTTP